MVSLTWPVYLVQQFLFDTTGLSYVTISDFQISDLIIRCYDLWPGLVISRYGLCLNYFGYLLLWPGLVILPDLTLFLWQWLCLIVLWWKYMFT